MAKDKSHTVDWDGLNLLISEINGVAPATVSTATVSTALKAKTEIAALTPSSTAADIVAALKA